MFKDIRQLKRRPYRHVVDFHDYISDVYDPRLSWSHRVPSARHSSLGTILRLPAELPQRCTPVTRGWI